MSILSEKHFHNETAAYKYVEARLWPGEAPEPERHAKKDDCGFCFVQAHGKYAKVDVFVLTLAFTASVEQSFADRSVRVERFELAALSPRAPPLSA